MIKSTIKNFLFPSVDGIVASLHRAVARLDSHRERSFAKADALRDRASAHIEQAYAQFDELHELAGQHEAEAVKALGQADKLRKLLA